MPARPGTAQPPGLTPPSRPHAGAPAAPKCAHAPRGTPTLPHEDSRPHAHSHSPSHSLQRSLIRTHVWPHSPLHAHPTHRGTWVGARTPRLPSSALTHSHLYPRTVTLSHLHAHRPQHARLTFWPPSPQPVPGPQAHSATMMTDGHSNRWILQRSPR